MKTYSNTDFFTQKNNQPPKRPVNNKSYFRLIFKLFIIFQVIFFIFNMFIFTYIRKTLNEDIKQYNKSTINAINSNFETIFTELSKISRATVSTVTKVDQLNHYDNFSVNDYILINDIKKDLMSILSIKELIDDWFYYNNEKDLIITSEGVYNSNDYIMKYFNYDGISYTDFCNLAYEKTEQIKIMPVTLLTEQLINGIKRVKNVVPFVMPYNPVTSQEAILVININVNQIAQIVSTYKTSDEMSIAVFDEFKNIVSTVGPAITEHYKSIKLENDDIKDYEITINQQKLNQVDTVIMSQNIFFPDWTVHIAVPTREFYNKSNIVFLFLMLANLFMAFLGVAIAYAFSRRLFSPIHNLLSILYPQSSANKRNIKQDELGLISKRLIEIEKDNVSITSDMNQFMPILKEVFIKNLLLKKDFLTTDENKEFLFKNTNLLQSAPFVICKINIIYKQSFIEFMTDNDDNLHKKVISLIISLILNSFSHFECIEIDSSNLVVLLNIKDPKEKQTVIWSLQEIQQVFSYDSDNILTTFLISDVLNDYDKICDANSTLQDVMDNMSIVNYGSVVDCKQQPLLDNRQINIASPLIINSIRTGDIEKAKDYLVKSIQDIYQKELSYQRLKSLHKTLYSICLDVLKEYNLETTSLQEFEIFSIQDLFSKDDVLDRIMDMLALTINLIDHKSLSRYDTYIAYIKNNYECQGLCLESAATDLNLSPAYLSKTFKEETRFSFTDYLSRYRIEKAKELLISTKDTVDDISTKVGISNRVTFNRLFNKYEGISPGKYRSLNIK